MPNPRIWILITDGVSARICSTDDGSTVAIMAPQEARSSTMGEPPRQRIDEAWYLQGGKSSLMGGIRPLHGPIAQILSEAAAEQAFDGLVIIAAPHIAAAIERALSVQTRAMMLADVVRDLPAFAAAEPDARMDLWH
jgi:hypothetical protein